MQQGTETRRNLSLSIVEFPHPRVWYNYTNPVGDKQKQKQLAAWHTAPRKVCWSSCWPRIPHALDWASWQAKSMPFSIHGACLDQHSPLQKGKGNSCSIWRAFPHRLHSLHMSKASLTPKKWMGMSSSTSDPKSVWLSLSSCGPEVGDVQAFGGYSGGRDTQDYKLHWAGGILNPAQLRDYPLPPLLPSFFFF